MSCESRCRSCGARAAYLLPGGEPACRDCGGAAKAAVAPAWTRLVWAAAPAAVAAAILAAAFAARRERVDRTWTPARLAAAVRAAGLDYEAKGTGPLGAWCLRAPGDGVSWEEIALGVPSAVFSRPGRVRVLYLPAASEPGGSVEDGRLRLGPLFLLGHPDDLKRIADAVGP